MLNLPQVTDTYFWALQVNFSRGNSNVDEGAGHTGFQWRAAHPGNRAVNWGGYEAGRPVGQGRVLQGSTSPLPSTPGDVNTRDFPWEAGVPYRFTVRPAGPAEAEYPPGLLTAWRATATRLDTGVEQVIRDLYAPGPFVKAAMVWSEVFAACDAPSVAVAWSNLTMLRPGGGDVQVKAVTVNYQPRERGGCPNTNSAVEDERFTQTTTVPRTTPQGTVLSTST